MWKVRFSIAGHGQFKKSLGTDDEREAAKRAGKMYYEHLIRAENGQTPKVLTFQIVAGEFIERIKKETAWGERSDDYLKKGTAVIDHYFIGFFGNGRRRAEAAPAARAGAAMAVRAARARAR